MTQPKPFMTLPEASKALGITRQAAHKLAVEEGHLYGVPVIQKTKHTRVVSRAGIERVVAGGTATPPPSVESLAADWFER